MVDLNSEGGAGRAVRRLTRRAAVRADQLPPDRRQAERHRRSPRAGHRRRPAPTSWVASSHTTASRSSRPTNSWRPPATRRRRSTTTCRSSIRRTSPSCCSRAARPGEPKAAVLRHRHLASYIITTVEFLGADADDAQLVSVPSYHVAGVSAVLSCLYGGRRICYLPGFDPEEWVRTVEDEQISQAMVVPTMLGRVLDEMERQGASLSSLRHLSYGGGRMPVELIERAMVTLPDVNYVNAYGLTETSSTIAVLTPDDHRESRPATIRQCVGGSGRSGGRCLRSSWRSAARMATSCRRASAARSTCVVSRSRVSTSAAASSPTTAGSRPTMPASLTSTGSSISKAASTTSSCAARRTSHPARSRRRCCHTRPWRSRGGRCAGSGMGRSRRRRCRAHRRRAGDRGRAAGLGARAPLDEDAAADRLLRRDAVQRDRQAAARCCAPTSPQPKRSGRLRVARPASWRWSVRFAACFAAFFAGFRPARRSRLSSDGVSTASRSSVTSR